MRRLISFVALGMFVPALAAAQVAPPPPPPTPPTPPLPAPSRPAPPPPVEWVMPLLDVPMVEMPELAMPWPDIEGHLRDAAWSFEMHAPVLPGMDGLHFAPFAFQSSGDSGYNSAMGSLSRRDYEGAVTRFDRVIARKGDQADAAMHWKAFALFKLGRSDDALATIAALRSEYPQSRYLNDARVLEADVRATGGQPPDPAAIDDDELKLLAIQGLQRSDPAGAVPLLEGVLRANNSLRVKERALYVLALTDLPAAHAVLMSYAKGAGNPDLQLRAISYLGSRRDNETTSQDLRAIYQSTTDTTVRMAVINAYRSSGDRAALVNVVRSGDPVVIRSRAVSNLASMAAPQDIWALYQNEQDAELRGQMVSALQGMKAVDQITQVARSERDGDVKRRAIRYLGDYEIDQTGKVLTDLYSVDDEVETRRAIIRALGEQDNAEALVAVARKDASPETIRDVVTRLSAMAGRSKVAADFLAEIIKR